MTLKVHAVTHRGPSDLPNFDIQTSSKYPLVTKSDTVDLPNGVCRALWVGTAGTANILEPDGTERALFPLQAGLNPIQVSRVKLGGTADAIYALY